MYSSSSETYPFSVSADGENSIHPHEGSKDLNLKHLRKEKEAAICVFTSRCNSSTIFQCSPLKNIVLQKSRCLILLSLFKIFFSSTEDYWITALNPECFLPFLVFSGAEFPLLVVKAQWCPGIKTNFNQCSIWSFLPFHLSFYVVFLSIILLQL